MYKNVSDRYKYFACSLHICVCQLRSRRPRRNLRIRLFTSESQFPSNISEFCPILLHEVPVESARMEVLLSANEQERIDYTVDVEQQLSSPVHEEAKTGRIFEPTTKQIGKILREIKEVSC